MVELGHWHPVARSDALGDVPLAALLLERELVLWRDAGGAVHAWSDRCPHRGARLSAGRVLRVDGVPGGARLECPYHGWRFGVDARCAEVPALPGFVPPAGHAACAHDACERHGMVWVRLAPGEVEPPPFPAEADSRLRKLACGPYDVETSAPRVVENFLDLAHFGFVHDGSLGERAHLEVADYRVEEHGRGVRATGCRAWQPVSSLRATGGALVDYEYEVVAPYTALLTKAPDPSRVAVEGFREAIALFVCPTGPERCRVWFRLAMADFESPAESMRAFQHAIFMEDAPIVASQRPRRLPLSPDAELHCAADRLSVAYRRYLRRLGVTFGTC